jgi:ABC-2 type transport system ATP-binding protein
MNNMNSIIKAQGLSKSYGDFRALDGIDLDIAEGRIVGLIGPNGAGKTTALRCMMGLATYDGQLRVLDKNPQQERMSLLSDIAYIADTAVLPRWIRVDQILEYMQGVHPKFNRQRAQSFLNETEITADHKVGKLSKGMVTQLHLALAISIDAKLLILDEPTLGLDILYRKRFYEQLLQDYFDEGRTIVITTHQVEEVEQLLTDLVFIKKGKIVLNMDMDQVAETYIELEVRPEQVEAARALAPISERSVLGGKVFMFENMPLERLQSLGTIRMPSVADLFISKMA